MKTWLKFLGLMTVGMVVDGAWGVEPAVPSSPANTDGALTPRIRQYLEMLKDTESLSQVSPEEEAQHQLRVRRLIELEASSIQPAAGVVIHEFAGTERPAAQLSNVDPAMDALIEAIEQLQMEVRELNLLIRRAQHPANGNDEPSTPQDNPYETLETWRLTPLR